MVNAIEVKKKEDKLAGRANTSLDAAHNLIVDGQATYERGREIVLCNRALKKDVENYWEPIKKAATEVLTGIRERMKANIAPIDEATDLVKDKMKAYDAEEDEKRRLEAEKLEAEKAATHQKRMTAAKKMVDKLKGQTGDIQGQINALEKELADGTENADLSDEEIQVLESEINVLTMSLKSKADAAELRARQAKEAEEAANATPTAAPASHEKTKGVSRPVTYKVEIVDYMALIKAIARGDVPFNPDKPLFSASKTVLKGLANGGFLTPGLSHGCRVTKDTGLTIK